MVMGMAPSSTQVIEVGHDTFTQVLGCRYDHGTGRGVKKQLHMELDTFQAWSTCMVLDNGMKSRFICQVFTPEGDCIFPSFR